MDDVTTNSPTWFLERGESPARILFIDFPSAFNCFRPHVQPIVSVCTFDIPLVSLCIKCEAFTVSVFYIHNIYPVLSCRVPLVASEKGFPATQAHREDSDKADRNLWFHSTSGGVTHE